jgi:hypothetical protein
MFAFEVGPNQVGDIAARMRQAGFEPVRTWSDRSSRAYVVVESEGVDDDALALADLAPIARCRLRVADVKGYAGSLRDLLPASGDARILGDFRGASAGEPIYNVPVYPCCGGIGRHAGFCTQQ